MRRPGDGTGRQVGTVTGRINGRTIEGTSIVNFQFFIDPNQNNPDGITITFVNRVVLMDLDGDQIAFYNVELACSSHLWTVR